MNFEGYSDCGVVLAVDLVNSAGATDTLPDVAALEAFVTERRVSAPGPITRAVLVEVHALRPRLRAIFEAPTATQAARVVNELLAETGALPQLSDHDGEAWHLHFTPPGAPLATRFAAESAMGLAAVIKAGGFERMSTCADDTCNDVFVDASRNRSRRFCNPDTCGNRSAVAAHRARRRAMVAG